MKLLKSKSSAENFKSNNNLSKLFYAALIFGCLTLTSGDFNKKNNYKQDIPGLGIDLDFTVDPGSNDLVCKLSEIDVIADSLIKKGNYKLAIDMLLQEKDSILKCNSDPFNKELWNIYSYLGQSYFAIEKYDLGLGYYEKAYQIAEKNSDNKDKLVNLNDIATGYMSLNKLDKAFPYLEKGYKILEELGENYDEGFDYVSYLIYTNLSNYYVNKKDFSKARSFFDKAKELAFNGADFGQETKVVVLSCEADFYINEGKFEKAILIYEQALKLAEEINHLEYKERLISAIEGLYIQLGDYKNAYKYQKKSGDVRGQRISTESEKAIKDSEIKYKTKEIEYINEVQSKELEIQKQKNRVALLSSLALGLLAVFSAGVGHAFRKKNKKITEQNQELNQANEELNVLNEQISSKNEELEFKNKEINSSISYAQKLQQYLLYNDIKNVFPKSFVFNSPRNLVSGDFYYSGVSKKSGKKFIALADCTGHGVPGAFLSIFGNDIIKQLFDQVDKPSQIIDGLDIKFRKMSENHNMNDSMEINCLFYDTESKILERAASDNSMIIIRNGKALELPHIQRNPIGSKYRRSDFFGYNTYEIQLMDGDEIYLFSDGIIDQFDYNTKKLMKSGFIRILESLSNIPFENKLDSIVDRLQNRVKNKDGNIVDQLDDQLLIGFKV